MPPQTLKEEIRSDFENEFPLPKFLAFSGGKGVERDLMLSFLSSTIDRTLERVRERAEGMKIKRKYVRPDGTVILKEQKCKRNSTLNEILSALEEMGKD